MSRTLWPALRSGILAPASSTAIDRLRRSALLGMLAVTAQAGAQSTSQPTPGSQPIAASPSSAASFQVQVPIDNAALRAQASIATWSALLDHGYASVSGAHSILDRRPAPLALSLAFDDSLSFKTRLASSQKLARAFIDQTAGLGFDVSISVHVFGTTRTKLGETRNASEAKRLVESIAQRVAEPRTNLRSLLKEVIDESASALRFPDGVREVVVFTDAGEESSAFPDYAPITRSAAKGGVLVQSFVFQPNTQSPIAATQADKLGLAVQQTGGYQIRVKPDVPLDPQTLADLGRAAALPSTLFEVNVSACGFTLPGPTISDNLRFNLKPKTGADWSSTAIALELPVPQGGLACPTPGNASSNGSIPAAASAASSSSVFGQSGPPGSVAESTSARSWPWILVALAVTTLLAIVALALRKKAPAPAPPLAATSQTPANEPREAPLPPIAEAAYVPVLSSNRSRIAAVPSAPLVPTPAPPPLVVPAPTPWLEPRKGRGPFAGTLVTELHVEQSPIDLGPMLRVPKPEVRVGRDPSLEMPLDLPAVSHHHATLSVDENGELYVIDVGSTNGTYLEQRRLSVNERCHVPVGSALWFSRQIRLRVVQPWRANTPVAPRPTPAPGQAVRKSRTIVDSGDPEDRS